MNLILMFPFFRDVLHNTEYHFILFIIGHYTIQITLLIFQINLILHQIPVKRQNAGKTVIVHDL